MSYTPNPISTSQVVLSENLLKLTERLAENAHDHWAQQRLRDGWRYGPRRDDVKREHPDLRPYSELPEAEKKYDRVTVMETIKAIIALGYSIEKSGAKPRR